jgi:hypothetical protein
MPLTDDPTVAAGSILLRVLRAGWTTTKGGRCRPASLAFFSTGQEISYFVEGPGVVNELWRIFPGHKIARIPAFVIRASGFVIERRPAECPAELQCDHASHVVAGPAAEITRNEFQRRAGLIAKHNDVSIIEPEAQAPQTSPQ